MQFTRAVNLYFFTNSFPAQKMLPLSEWLPSLPSIIAPTSFYNQFFLSAILLPTFCYPFSFTITSIPQSNPFHQLDRNVVYVRVNVMNICKCYLCRHCLDVWLEWWRKRKGSVWERGIEKTVGYKQPFCSFRWTTVAILVSCPLNTNHEFVHHQHSLLGYFFLFWLLFST